GLAARERLGRARREWTATRTILRIALGDLFFLVLVLFLFLVLVVVLFVFVLVLFFVVFFFVLVCVRRGGYVLFLVLALVVAFLVLVLVFILDDAAARGARGQLGIETVDEISAHSQKPRVGF